MTECFARRLKFGVCVQPQPYGSRQCRFSESKSSKIALTDALSFRPNTTFPVYCSVRLDYSVRRQNPSFDYLRDFFTFLCFDEQTDKRLCKHKKTAFAVFAHNFINQRICILQSKPVDGYKLDIL